MVVTAAVADHPADEDKHGNEVALRTAVAVMELRDHSEAAAVMCDYHSTGRIQFYSRNRDVGGAVIRLAQECEYELDFATTRSRNGDRHGYAEFVPAEADR